jgi:hypothetical protein
MFTAGFACVDVTPPLGAHIPGGFSPRVADGILDPLGVHACVLAGEQTVALVGVDAVSIPEPVVRAARQQIAASLPLVPEAILVAASHTHCGGPANDVLGTDADPAYQERLARAIAEAVGLAWDNRVPATLAGGSASCPGWAFNRRWRMRGGGEATNPGKTNPDRIAPAGPVDDEVGAMVCRDLAGQTLGYIGNFACHSTVIWGNQFSADYAAYWREALGAPLVFLNGACGDINQIDFSNPDTKENGIEHAKAMGAALAEATERALADAEALADPVIRCACATISLELRIPTTEQQAEDDLLAAEPRATWSSRHWQARDRLLLVESLAGRTTLDCELTAYRIGDVVIPAAPWQPFCEFGLYLKRNTAANLVFPATFANGCIGYVPTRQGFAGGGYEPTLCRGSKLVPEAGEAIEAGLVELAGALDG